MGEKGVSVTLNVVGDVGRACSVVPQARRPVAKLAGGTLAALQAVPAVVTIFTTTLKGTPGVSVLLIKSDLVDKETSAPGVTVHEQQDTNCSSGANVYTLAHRLDIPPWVVVARPTLVILITESPMAKFDT